MQQHLPSVISAATAEAAEEWSKNQKVASLWKRDKTLWTGSDEDKWLGWLDIADRQLEHRDRFQTIADQIKSKGYPDAVLLGMGGPSLCPEVLCRTFGQQPEFPVFHVLDSTDPAQVLAVRAAADPVRSLYIVSTKSGSTLEPNIFKQYFFEEAGNDGSRFVAITDPGSKMLKVAEADHFVSICYGDPCIAGRYSALSDFGMVAGAVMGIDIPRLLEGAVEMARRCGEPNAAKNPGVSLGLALGTLALHGHDKVTLIASPAICDVSAWLEQLIAESTGKRGKGLIPVDREPAGTPEVYGKDRVFAYVRYAPEPDAAQDAAIAGLQAAGQPVIQIDIADKYDLGGEFFRWEIAIAVAGAVIGVNPFDQPDVEASRIATRKLTEEFEKTGKLPPEEPQAGTLRDLLESIRDGDYFAILAYIQMNPEHEQILHSMRLAVRDAKKVATCAGFGPRFLHSTGQAYKGGPNTGVFLQITCDDARDVAIPGQTCTFGVVKAAQARGDLGVLKAKHRRALRVHIQGDLREGLTKLQTELMNAL